MIENSYYPLTLAKYFLTYILLYLIGRSFYITACYLFKINNKKTLLFVKKELMYPIIGVAFLGNLLVVLNFALPIDSIFTYIIIFLILSINFFDIKLPTLNILTSINFLYYIIIPAILIVSLSNINFHYDAGYYHLNNQNWIRNSNITFGLVNFFWAFGMSSIYEYVLAFFWFDSDFLNLHHVNLVFIHWFYQFLTFSLLKSKSIFLKNASFFILIFSIFDNFGFQGGRNGFIYIEGVGKQDMPVAILFLFISLISLLIFQNKIRIDSVDMLFYSFLVLFVIQIKLSASILVFLYLLLIFQQYKLKQSIQKIVNSQFIVFIFGLVWVLKNFITTGCFLFPLNSSCINAFTWYSPESTRTFQDISTQYSMNYIIGDNFMIWVSKFLEYSFYKSLLLNFSISLLLIVILRLLFFNKSKNNKVLFFITIFYVIANITYLILFGPIPRYATGLLMLIVGSLAIGVREIKVVIPNFAYYILISASIFLLIRFDSYSSLLNNNNLLIFDPREESRYITTENGYLSPDAGDQCWVNLKCTMNRDTITITNGKFFKTISN
tara:strand:- start:9968 stop:11623 length:1656 start_codon:yes stop_codon:yes gene_type:complete